MVNGLIMGALGGMAGFGSAMSEMARDKRHELAERLKLELMEQMNIRAEDRQEGRAIASDKRSLENQKDFAKFGNELPLSTATSQEMDKSLTNTKALDEYRNTQGLPASEREKMRLQFGYEGQLIDRQGRIQEKLAGARQKEDFEKTQEQALKRLAVKLSQSELPTSYDPETGALQSEAMDEAQQKRASEIARSMGMEVSFGKPESVDKPGVFTGESNVAFINGAVFTGNEEKKEKFDAGADLAAILKEVTTEKTPPQTKAPETKPGPVAKPAQEKYVKYVERNGVIYGVRPDGQPIKVMAKPPERTHNNRYHNKEYAEYLELLKKVSK